MFRAKHLSLLLLPAIMFSACQLFEPLPTLHGVTCPSCRARQKVQKKMAPILTR